MSVLQRLIAGVRNWRKKLSILCRSEKIGGIEWLVVVIVHFLHITTLAGWIKFYFDPISNDPTAEELRRRNKAIDIYVVFEFCVLQCLLWLPDRSNVIYALAALYFLCGILINLFSIVFVGKLDVYPPTPSIERSLLLFGINVIQVITIFAIFYRTQFCQSPLIAIINSTLVFGTLGHPLGNNFIGGYIVATQIIVDFVLLAVFLSAFVGSLNAFKRKGVENRTKK